MPLTMMEHYLVLTSDIEGTRDFYRDALGMQVGFRPSLGFPGYWMYVGPTPCIHIAEWDTYTAHSNSRDIPVSHRAAGTGAFDHVAFNAQDFEDVLERLGRFGVSAKHNLVPDNGLRQLFLTDPNGVKIELNFRATS